MGIYRHTHIAYSCVNNTWHPRRVSGEIMYKMCNIYEYIWYVYTHIYRGIYRYTDIHIQIYRCCSFMCEQHMAHMEASWRHMNVIDTWMRSILRIQVSITYSAFILRIHTPHSCVNNIHVWITHGTHGGVMTPHEFMCVMLRIHVYKQIYRCCSFMCE